MYSKHKKKIWFILLFFFVGAGLITIGLYKKIYLKIDKDTIAINTWAITVEQLLSQQRIEISLNDKITPAIDAKLINGAIIEIQRASSIQAEIDGTTMMFFAVNPIPSELLKQAGIQIYPGDILLSENNRISMNEVFTTHHNNHFWQLLRTVPYTLQDENGSQTLSSTAATVGQALWESGVEVHFSDRLLPSFEAPLSPNMVITLNSARPVTIQTDQTEINLLSSADTISGLLLDAGLSLQGLDYTIPNETELIPNNGSIRLVRVTEDIMIEQTPIPFDTEYQAVSDLEIDRQTILEAGEYGLNAQRIRIRYENGQEISRQVEGEWLAKKPQNRIIGYGTQIVMRSIDTADGVVNYWRALDVYAVSYKPSDTGGNITSTGQVLKKGIIAVNPNYIPYGTILYVPGYGYGVAADTGRLSARMIDLGYTDEDYVSWHQNITVYLVWPPPDSIVWLIP